MRILSLKTRIKGDEGKYVTLHAEMSDFGVFGTAGRTGAQEWLEQSVSSRG